MSLQPGSLAPHFTASVIGGEYETETTISLNDFLGKERPVVLYFYPKDNTPGCTKQACSLRDNWAAVRAKAQIFGVSTDSIASHVKFQKKHDLPFPIIADPNKSVVQAYGVWGPRSLYGIKYTGTDRSTFIINPDGTIRTVLEKVKAGQHLEKLLEALA
jgi:peroxiredoxin Q/BCP